MSKQSQTFSVRKNKAVKTLCGAVLGTFIALSIGAGASVSADEVVANNTPTTAVADQTTSVSDNNTNAENVDTTAGVVQLAVDNSAVANAVTTAQTAGVSVSQTDTVDKGTATTEDNLKAAQNEISADQKAQVTALEQATAQADDRQSAYNEARTAYDALKKQVSDAQASGGNVTVETGTVSSGDGKDVAAYNNYAQQVKTQIESNQTALDKYNQERTAMLNNNNVTIDGRVTTQNVDRLTYGNSTMNGNVNTDGTFSFTHDMNDGANDTLGVLGTGTLTGRVNFDSKANADGSITVNIPSLYLGSYDYTANRTNTAVNQNLNYHVYTTDGQEAYNTVHTGNSSFTNNIDRTIELGQSYTLQPGEQTGLIPVLNIDDNWIINTHGQLYLDFTNPNQVPSVLIKNLNAPVNPVKPSATYHDYSLSYKPTVQPVKSVLDKDGNDIDTQTVKDRDIQFKLKTDYSPYKGLYASQEAMAKAVGILDDVQDGAYTVKEDAIAINDSKGSDIKNLFDMYHVLSGEARSEVVANFLAETGLKPEGEFLLWIPKDKVAYYKDYVLAGNDVTITLPVFLTAPAGTKIENDFSQVEFGNATDSNLVFINTPEEPETPSVGEQTPPAPEVPQAPVQQQAVLPSTGEVNSGSTTLIGLGLLMSMFGLVGIKRKHNN